MQRLCLKACLVTEVSAVGTGYLLGVLHLEASYVFMHGIPAPVLIFLSCAKTGAFKKQRHLVFAFSSLLCLEPSLGNRHRLSGHESLSSLRIRVIVL